MDEGDKTSLWTIILICLIMLIPYLTGWWYKFNDWYDAWSFKLNGEIK